MSASSHVCDRFSFPAFVLADIDILTKYFKNHQMHKKEPNSCDMSAIIKALKLIFIGPVKVNPELKMHFCVPNFFITPARLFSLSSTYHEKVIIGF